MENVTDHHGENALPGGSCVAMNSLKIQGPYEYSLPGEYFRMLLLLAAVPLLMWFAHLTTHQHVPLPSLIAAGVLLASLMSTRGIIWLRAFLLAAMTFNVLAVVINPDEVLVSQGVRDALVVPNMILLICLTVASGFEISNLLRKGGRLTSFKFLCWGMLAIPAIGYIAGIPLFNSLWESLSGDISNAASKDPDWTMPREMAFRAAKFVVFGIFTYFGACIGSFLNVVAYCIPRGESVGMRDSSCPQCKTKIRRVDNLPVFSYINLSARCRSCENPIPARYLIVELLVAAIFGSLFLYELVTGASNVPSTNGYPHTGILWMVLYPKWDIIGIYLFHSFFMSFLLVLSLIEWDRQKLALRFSVAILLPFLVSATLFFPLQPIPPLDFLSSLTGSIPPVSQFAKLAFGAIVGAVVASCLVFVTKRKNRSTFVTALALVGIVLGWQSVLHVSVLFVLMLFAVRFVPRLRNSLCAQPTFILLVAVMIHHPIWRMVFEQFSI